MNHSGSTRKEKGRVPFQIRQIIAEAVRRLPPPGVVTRASIAEVRRVIDSLRNQPILILAAVTIALTGMRMPRGILTNELDPSWAGVLESCARLGHQFGTDTVYTFGPLGYFETAYYSREFFHDQIDWQIFSRSLIAALLALATSRLAPVGRWLLFGAVVILQPDALMVGLLAGSLLLATSDGRELRWAALLSAPLLIAAPMIKFTFALTILPAMISIIGIHLLAGRRRFAIGYPLVLAISFLITWTLIGQSPWNLPAYVINSLSVTSGYSVSMVRDGELSWLVVSLVTLGAIVAAVLFPVASTLYCRRWRDLATAILVAGIPLVFLFLTWKHGFVRSDAGHASLFFTIAPSIAALGLLAGFSPSWGKTMVVTACLSALVGLRIIGMNIEPFAALDQIAGNAKTLIEPDQSERQLKRALKASAAAAALPRTVAVVGDQTVDVFGHRQGAALLNNLKLSHRPVFQSFTAYNSRLISLNDRFYRSEKRPEFVLFALEGFDRRFTPLDDSKALRTILGSYKPILFEDHHLLFQSTGAPLPELRFLKALTVHPGDRIDLSDYAGRDLWIEADISSSAAGAIRSIAYKPTRTTLKITRATSEPDRREYFFAACAAPAGCILSPLLLQPDDIRHPRNSPPGDRSGH